MNKRKKYLIITIALLVLALVTLVFTTHHLVNRFLPIPSVRTATWQTVVFEEVANFRVPSEWIVEIENGTLFITDSPRKYHNYYIYLVGIVHERNLGMGSPHELIPNVERGRLVGNSLFSHNTRIYTHEYRKSDVSVELSLIEFVNIRTPERNALYLLVLNNDVVTEDIVVDIAMTFRSER